MFMCLERYIALYYPFKVHIYCTIMHTSFGIIALKIVTCISCIPCFYSCSIRWLDGMHVCRTFGENSKHIIISMSIILALYSIVPFILITTLNILMMRKIQKVWSYIPQFLYTILSINNNWIIISYLNFLIPGTR